MMKALKLIFCLVVLALVWSNTQVVAQEKVVSKKSQVTFGGRLHGQFHTSSVEGASPNNTFYVRRARLAATYKNLSGTMEAKVQYDLGEGGVKLKDGFVDLKLDPRFNIKLGQYKKPFSLWELTSTTKTMVIERGNQLIGSQWKGSNQIVAKDGLYAGRDIGIMIHGKGAKVAYELGLFNGNGYHKKSDDDSGKLIGGRLVVNPAKDWAVGGSFSNRTVSEYAGFVDTTKNGESANFQAFEIDLEYGIKDKVAKTGPWLQGEFLFGSNPHYSDEAKFMGFVLVGSYNVKLSEEKKVYSIRPAIRFDYARRNTDDEDTKNILLTPGMDIFFDPYNRVQINLDLDIPQAKGADTEFGLRIQFQMHI